MSGVEAVILTGGAGQAIGSAVAPATEAGKGIYQCLKRKYDYIKNLPRNYEKLEQETRYLFSREEDIKREIDDGQPAKEPTSECNTWLQDVERERRKVEDLKTRYVTVTGSCASCSLRSRLKLSKEIVKMTGSVVHLYNRTNHGRDVVVKKQPPDMVPRGYPKNITKVQSLCEHVKKLLALLADVDVKRIGIWGMFGVGKTTILESLKREVEQRQIFEIVLWVKVETDPHEMQQEIMEQLRVKAEDLGQAEGLISRKLEGKKYLLLLDGVSSQFDFRCIGFRDSHNCKVVLTTREREICRSMKTNEEIKVGKLSREDARKLFRDIVGEEADRPTIMPIAERVLKQCGDLPQVIKAVGNHLNGKSSGNLWRGVLSKLQSPIMFQLTHLEDVYNSFVATYEKLDDYSKNCLLYAASFPGDHEIYRDYLVECWKVEQLISKYETFREARQEGHVSLEEFVNKFLFDRGKSLKFVKMPNIFRNAARRMAGEHNFVLLVKDSEKPPPMELWANAKVISFMNSNLNELPPLGPDCSVISTFFLQKNKMLLGIPLSFFDRMTTLKLLDLCGTGIGSLPPSISKLTCLKGLYLSDCHKLVDLPKQMGLMPNLELLDICRSGIYGFHVVIGELTQLRCLRVSFARVVGGQKCFEANNAEATPSNIIQPLVHLEELTIDVDPNYLEWKTVAPKIVAEVAKLEKLSALSFYFPSIESLETFTQKSIPWKRDCSEPGQNFPSFSIYVCTEMTHKPPRFDVYDCSDKRYLYYSNGKDVSHVIKDVLKRTCAFQLMTHQNIIYFSEFGIDEMKGLEACQVEGCNAMIAFLGSQIATTPAFPWLKELYLCQLQQLNAIFQGPVTPNSFAHLTTLTVEDCPNLIEVTSWEVAKQLCKLKYLKVGNCPLVNEILGADVQSSGGNVFPKLKTLQLSKLEGLVSIHSDASFKWPKLDDVEIDECHTLVNTCLSKTSATKLRHIRCNRAWWQKMVMLKNAVVDLHVVFLD